MVDSRAKTDPVFETVDYGSTPVVLSRVTWQAKAGNDKPGEHPEVRDYLEDARLTIEKPDYVFQSTRDRRSRLFYRLSVGRSRFAGKHLVVVVRNRQQIAFTEGGGSPQATAVFPVTTQSKKRLLPKIRI